MSFFDFQRLDNILNLLIQKKNPVRIDELSSTCGVSDRTIRSDINTINDYIREKGARIILIRKQGYTLDYWDKDKFDNFWNNQGSGTFLFTSADSRLTYLIRLFLTSDDYISQDYLQSILFVSQNTLYNDFRTLKQKLSAYNLTLVNKSNLGYLLDGSEKDRRSAIISLIFKENISDYLTASSTVEKDICININYETFTHLFTKHFRNLIPLDSDYFHRNLFTYLLLAISRIKSGKIIDTFDKALSLNEETNTVLTRLIAEIQQTFAITFSIAEQNYLEFILAENFPSLICKEATADNQVLSQNIVSSILATLQKLTDASWVSDRRLKNNLLEHIKLFLNIQTIDGQRANPILDTIKNNFPYAFELAITCVQEIVREYSIHFSEDEISYIALHFANAIERNIEAGKTFSLAIICGSGETFSSIIASKIKRRFPSTFSKIVKYSFLRFQNEGKQENFDLIVSTIPIKNDKQDILFLDINDLDASMALIEHELMESSKGKQHFELLSPKRFLNLQERTSKEELLQQLADILQEQHFVSEAFLTELKEREAISSTLISDSVALPHPLGNSVLKSTIFPVIAPKGITWDGKTIKFVFLFAIRAEDSQHIQFVYEQLLDFISSEKMQSQLLKEPHFETLLTIFST